MLKIIPTLLGHCALLLATGLLAATLAAQAGPLPDVGITKTPTQRLLGRVTRGGKPLAGAKVVAAWRTIAASLGETEIARNTTQVAATTDEGGNYSLFVPPWRELRVHATHEGGVSAFRDGLSAPVDGSVDLEIEDAVPLKGSFTMTGNKAVPPLRFALDRLLVKKDSVPFRVFGTSDANGAFVVEGLPKGTWQLRVVVDDNGLRPAGLALVENGKDAANRIEVIEGSGTDVVFSDRSGRPASDVAVEVVDHGILWSGKSDAQGRIALRGLQRGHATTIVAAPTSLGSRRYYALEPGVTPGGDIAPETRLQLAESYTVSGRVFGIEGTPAKDITIVFRGTIHGAGFPPSDFSHVVKTDADGRYSCATLDKHLFFEVEAMIDGEVQPIGIVDPRPALFKSELDAFRIGFRRIAVDVAVPAGGPHAFEARVYGPRDRGDITNYKKLIRVAGSVFTSPCLSPGEYAALAVSDSLGFARSETAVRANTNNRASTDLKLSLSEPRVLEGKVLDSFKKPVAGAKVALVFEGADFENQPRLFSDQIALSLMDQAFPASRYPREATSGSDGSFRFVCPEGNGFYDIIATRDANPNQGGAAPPVRTTRVLALRNPIELLLR